MGYPPVGQGLLSGQELLRLLKDHNATNPSRDREDLPEA